MDNINNIQGFKIRYNQQYNNLEFENIYIETRDYINSSDQKPAIEFNITVLFLNTDDKTNIIAIDLKEMALARGYLKEEIKKQIYRKEITERDIIQVYPQKIAIQTHDSIEEHPIKEVFAVCIDKQSRCLFTIQEIPKN